MQASLFARGGATVTLLSLALGAACGDNAPYANDVLAGGEFGTVFDRTSHAFSFPMPGLTAAELDRHAGGDLSFEAVFVTAPAPVNPGLGPAFNHNTCIQCHLRDGRGLVNFGAANSQALVRVSMPGTPLAHQGAVPVPGLGLQVQDHAVFGQEPEARVEVTWEEMPVTYADGTMVTLRKPAIALSTPEGVPISGLQTSLRVGPSVFGLGLLAAVPDDALFAAADPEDVNGDGVSGRVNLVWDVTAQAVVPGRFGLKANTPTLRQQAAGAYAEDMGVTNELFPDRDEQDQPLPTYELPSSALDSTEFYLLSLAVPHRAPLTRAAKRGERLFAEFGCANCHSPVLQTGPHAVAALAYQSFAPYTDLLLHDMGEGLADGRPDFAASGTEWRTTPLWGLGLVRTVLLNGNYLHDGRARSIEEAILWHGGEAATAQEAFRNAPADDRGDLLDFLQHL